MEKIDEFISFLLDEGLSKNTIDSYKRQLNVFDRWLAGRDIDSKTLNDFKKYQIQNKKPQTVCVSIVAINKWLEFVGRTERLKTIKLPRYTFRDNVLSFDDYKKMLKTCLIDKGLRHGFKYYCIIRILATTGIRISELTKISLDDYKKGYADIVSKANHARRVYIPKETSKAVLQYCEHYGKKNVFEYTKTANRAVAMQLKEIAKKSGVDENLVYPHAFRHLFAKMFLQKNKDISLLADILGHQSINTTQIYMRKTALEQEDEFRKVVDW